MWYLNAKSLSERLVRVLHFKKHSFTNSSSWIFVLLMYPNLILYKFYCKSLKMKGVLFQGN